MSSPPRFVKSSINFTLSTPLTAASITTVLSILICLLFSGATLSYNIIYDGNVVAQVSEKAVYQNAFEKAEGMLVSDNAETVLTDAKIKPVLSFKEDNDNETELAKIILTNSADVTDGYILKVDGKNTLYLDNNDSYHALAKCGGLVFTGPTGTNVNDVAVILIRALK